MTSHRGKCILCESEKELTRDHIIPRLFGGGGGKNIRYICHDCNSRRNHRIGVAEWSLMDERQQGLFWDWLGAVLQRRLKQVGYGLAHPEAAHRDEELLRSLPTGDFTKLLPMIEAGNIPGFK